MDGTNWFRFLRGETFALYLGYACPEGTVVCEAPQRGERDIDFIGEDA